MREIRTLRATWRGLETWNGREYYGRPARQSSTLLGRGRRKSAMATRRPPTPPQVRFCGSPRGKYPRATRPVTVIEEKQILDDGGIVGTSDGQVWSRYPNG